MPRVGREIITPDGTGVINAINVLEETVRVRIAVGDSFELREYRIDDCTRVGQDTPQGGSAKNIAAAADADAQEQGAPAVREEEVPASRREDTPPRAQQQDRPPRAPRGRGDLQPNRSERPERSGRGEKPGRPERGERPARDDRLARGGKFPQQGRRFSPQGGKGALQGDAPAQMLVPESDAQSRRVPGQEARVIPTAPPQSAANVGLEQHGGDEDILQLREQSAPEDLL